MQGHTHTSSHTLPQRRGPQRGPQCPRAHTCTYVSTRVHVRSLLEVEVPPDNDVCIRGVRIRVRTMVPQLRVRLSRHGLLRQPFGKSARRGVPPTAMLATWTSGTRRTLWALCVCAYHWYGVLVLSRF
jgi:hypothetical protein